MTDFHELKNIKIPSDLTSEQIYEMFQVVSKVAWKYHKRSPFHQIAESVDQLVEWYMKQDFEKQSGSNSLKEEYKSKILLDKPLNL